MSSWIPSNSITANVSRNDMGMDTATTRPRRQLPRNRKITTAASNKACQTLPNMLPTTCRVKEADSSASLNSTFG